MKDFVLQVSKPNIDVKEADSRDLIVNSDRGGLKIIKTEIIDYTFPDDPDSRTLTIPHDLGYIPLAWGVYKANRGIGKAEGLFPWYDGVFVEWEQRWALTMDRKNVYLDYTSIDGDTIPAPSIKGENFKFKVYISNLSIE